MNDSNEIRLKKQEILAKYKQYEEAVEYIEQTVGHAARTSTHMLEHWYDSQYWVTISPEGMDLDMVMDLRHSISYGEDLVALVGETEAVKIRELAKIIQAYEEEREAHHVSNPYP